MRIFFKRSRKLALQYYVYISQTKLEFLVPQMPAPLLRSLEADIKVNIAGLAAGVRKPASAPSPELAAKARVHSLDYYVLRFLRGSAEMARNSR
ncbi:DUF7019 family protein [Streptomyces sp. NPDC054933]